MNKKLLTTAMLVSIAMGAYSAPIYTVLDLNNSLLIQSDSSKDSLESDSEKLLALGKPKDKKSKKEVEEEVEDEDEETSDDEEVDGDSENEGDDSDSDDSDDDESSSTASESDDDDDGADYTEEGDENGEPSSSGGFGDIKSRLENKNTNLPVSKSEYHVHKNAPHNTVTNNLNPQGSVQEYITYLFGDEIILTHTLVFNPNGTYNINAKVNTSYKTMTPPTVVSNTIQSGRNWITEFTYFGGKIITTFTLTPTGNNLWKIDYKWNMKDSNL